MTSTPRDEKWFEFKVFVFVAACVAPAISLVLIGAIGLSGWAWQIFNGPPGPS